MFPDGKVFVYDFSQNHIPGSEEEEKGYWKDVGTLDTFWEANMDFQIVSAFAYGRYINKQDADREPNTGIIVRYAKLAKVMALA